MKVTLKSWLAAVLMVLAAPFTVVSANESYCDSYNNIGCNSGFSGYSCNQQKKCLWSIGGWMETGIYGNEYGQDSAYLPNGQGFNRLSGNGPFMLNTGRTDLEVNQLWTYAEKKLSNRGWDIGGRVDLMYGTDGAFLQSNGFERESDRTLWGSSDYFMALPQAYGEIGYDNVSVKAGKFLSLLGYESAMSPERFFYSLSYAYEQNPATMTGVVGTWNATERFSVTGGWINGTDNTFDSSDDTAWVAALKYRFNCRTSLSYAFVAGEENIGDADLFQHSLIFQHKPGKRWDYVLEWTLKNTEDTFDGKYGAYGLNNELIYQLNCNWSLGARAEWMRYYNYEGSGADFNAYGFTVGANWTPACWLIVKPEVRYDICDGSGVRPFNVTRSNYTNMQKDQMSFGCSAIITF